MWRRTRRRGERATPEGAARYKAERFGRTNIKTLNRARIFPTHHLEDTGFTRTETS
jgi:hypothetical protein